MDLNLHIDKTINVTLNEKSYPISIGGTGIPCLTIGLGSLMQRTLSKRFKQHFKVYAADLYWDSSYALDNRAALTMDQIINDIVTVGYNLQLSSYIIIAHSAFGLAALACAAKYPTLIAGIIMIGTPPHINAASIARYNEYFEQHADPVRKSIDTERRSSAAQEALAQLDPATRLLREFIWRDAPRYWHIPDFDCTELWNDINIDAVFDHYLWNILAKIDATKYLDTITCPIFCAAGDSDYDCCPFFWREVNNFPAQMTISQFKESGHWPHYEEQALFDEQVVSWWQHYKKN